MSFAEEAADDVVFCAVCVIARLFPLLFASDTSVFEESDCTALFEADDVSCELGLKKAEKSLQS